MTTWTVKLYAVLGGNQVGDNRPLPESNVKWTTKPTASNPINNGDTIVVQVEDFANYAQQFPDSTYWDLHVAAVSSADFNTVNTKDFWDPHGTGSAGSRQSDILTNITLAPKTNLGNSQNGTQLRVVNYPANGPNYCSGATFDTSSLTRDGKTTKVITYWSFQYNPSVGASSSWNLVFCFGDPHVEGVSPE